MLNTEVWIKYFFREILFSYLDGIKYCVNKELL